MPSNPSDPPRKKRRDVVWVHSQSADGEALNVVRARGDEVSFGQVRKVAEGKPIVGDLVSLKPREGAPRLFDVETLHAAGDARSGPAKVSSPAYRRGWAEAFGAKRRPPESELN